MTTIQSINIGILRADDVRAELADTYGEYPEMIQALLAQANNWRSNNDKPVDLVFKTYSVHQEEYPEHIDDVDAYVLTGSKYSVYEDIPWIHRLFDFVQVLDQHKKKLVGICFGHQMVAHALGGRTEKSNKGWGIGVKPAAFKPEASGYGLNGNAFSLAYSHQDQVVTPATNSVTLAANDFCPIAMSAIGDHILTVQGHPEFSHEFAEALYQLRRDFFSDALYNEAVGSMDRRADNVLVAEWMLDFMIGE